LATVGCGCYPGVKEALMAALDDCTEEVRLEAVQAFQQAAGNRCNICNDTCCGEDVVEKLAKIAYERDDQGCWLEPSERVRQAAIDAIRACCPNRGPSLSTQPVIEPEPIQPEPIVPEGTTPEGTTPLGDPPPVPMAQGTTQPPVAFLNPGLMEPGAEAVVIMDSDLGEVVEPFSVIPGATQTPAEPARLRTTRSRSTPPLPAQDETVPGQVVEHVRGEGAVLVWFAQGWRPHLGSRVQVYRRERYLGDLQVIESRPQGVKARPLGTLPLAEIRAGDSLVYEGALQRALLPAPPRRTEPLFAEPAIAQATDQDPAPELSFEADIAAVQDTGEASATPETSAAEQASTPERTTVEDAGEAGATPDENLEPTSQRAPEEQVRKEVPIRRVARRPAAHRPRTPVVQGVGYAE
jgi:hypothetical protein